MFSQSAIDRFWSKIDTSGECWEWRARIRKDGYGQFWVGDKGLRAHRVAWMITNGPIPDGLFVCHTCDNPKCVRPDHLFLGTNRENQIDAIQKGRHVPHRFAVRKGEQHHGAKLTECNVREIRNLHEEPNGFTVETIARMYGVERTTISRIILGKAWRHVQ